MIPEEKIQEMKKSCDEILYRDKTFMIGAKGDGHAILVNDIFASLGRGILRDIAQEYRDTLESLLERVANTVLYEIREKNISLMEVGRVCALAVIQESEGYAAAQGVSMNTLYTDSNTAERKRLAKESRSNLIGWQCAKKTIEYLKEKGYLL